MRGLLFCGEVTAVEHPVCLEGQRAGTLYVYPGARETELRAVCRGTERGLYRLYVQGERGEVLLGVTEDGCLHRRFSRELLEPAGAIRCGVLRRCGGEETAGPGFLARLPPGARLTRQGGCVRAALPWREGEPLPLTELFCFARVEPGLAVYLFDGAGRPVMPKI